MSACPIHNYIFTLHNIVYSKLLLIDIYRNSIIHSANAETMPGKLQLLIFLGQQTILNLQNGEATVCSYIQSQR